MLSEFYRSKEWIALTQFIKLDRVNDNGELICDYCHLPIVNKFDCICHHVTELTSTNYLDSSISLNPDNIQCVHHRCHNAIHARFGFERQKVYLVYGSPCSGKTTYVNSIAGREDIIVDIDELWNAICIDGISKPDRLKQNVFGLRDCLLDQIKVRRGKWRNAYIVGTYPLMMERKRFCEMYGAEVIHIDTDKDVCMTRAKDKPSSWKKFIEEYWDRYQA